MTKKKHEVPEGTIELPEGHVGVPYAASVDAQEPEAVAGIIQAGALPEGMTLVLEEVSGVPTTAGNYSFTLWHINANGYHVGQPTAYSITIA